MTTATATEPIAITLPIGVLRESKLNTRHTYNENKMAELVDSIKRLGVLTPLLVRPKGKDVYEIAAGHRRYRAAKIAGVQDVPVTIRELSDSEFLEVLLIENLQREDVHELDEANGYQQLMKTAGYDVATLAEKVGKSEAYIYARLKLCDLLPEIQKKFYAGELTAGHAILIARLPEHQQIETVKKGLYHEHWDHISDKHVKDVVGVRALTAWIQNNIHMELAKACFSPKDAELLPAAGACDVCPKRSGFNPQLFPELGKKDVCTDRVCFGKKIDAFIKLKVDSGEMIELTTDYSNRALPSWYSAPTAGGAGSKKCEHAVTGICVDGYEKGKTKKVCVTKACKVHHGKSSLSGSDYTRNESPKEKEKRLAESKTRKDAETFQKHFRARLFEEISKDAGKVWPEHLQLVAYALIDRLSSGSMGDEELVDFEKEYGVPSSIRFGWDAAALKKIEKLDQPKLARLIIQLLMVDAIENGRSMSEDCELLLLLAKLHSINSKPIAAEIREEMSRVASQVKKIDAKKTPPQTSAKTKPAAKPKQK